MTRSRGLEGGRTLLGNTRPALWLGVIVTSSFIVSTIGGLAFTQPIVFRDELVYSSAAKAVVHGPDGVSRFAYGAYPLLIAPIYALLGNVQHAYAAIKIANGAAFALAAVPAYLLARRVAPATLALGVALLTVLLPARVYSYLVFSESG